MRRMSELVDVVVWGSAGRMGQAVVRAVLQSKRARLASALVRPGSGLADEPLDRVFGSLPRDVDFETSLDPDTACDVIVDFSGPVVFDAALALAIERRVGFVSGTTGLKAEQFAAMERAAQTIPVLWSANFSLGIAMLFRTARRIAGALPGWDAEIVEIHHNRKEDAPSGTALSIGNAIADGRKQALADHGVYQRHGHVGARKPGEIGFSTMRGGDIVGEHTIVFATEGERLEITHRAGSRDIFAKGALEAAIWIARRAPGVYTFDEVLAPPAY
jgi:4-hydroxy-tetrahydrodipicolinate reductase